MRVFQLLVILSLLAVFVGCGEPHADLSTPKSHRSGAITFDYPQNWKITTDSVSPEVHNLFVETDGDALVIFQSYPVEGADELPAFAKAFSDGASTQMPIGKIVGSTFADMPATDGFEWIEETFHINLLGESVPHRRLYGSKEIGDRRVFLIFQVATEDYAKAEPGFQLIQKSLRGIEKAEQSEGGQPVTRSESK